MGPPIESLRRRSDGHNEPQMQVVGFHVEGQSPSPSPSSILQDSLRTISAGSPTPVIIPPQFQREASLGRQDLAANRSLAPEFAAGQQAGHAPRAQPSASGRPQGSAGGSAAPPSQAPAAAAADAAAAAAAGGGTTQAPAAAAAAAALAAAAANTATVSFIGSSSGGSAATTAPRGAGGEQQQSAASSARAGEPGAAATAAAPAAGADGAAAAAGGGLDAGSAKPPPKTPKLTSKAERRALQEAQRAAKAAVKGGGAPSGSGSSKPPSGAGAVADGAATGKPPRAPSASGGGGAAAAGAVAGGGESGAGRAAAGAGAGAGTGAAGAASASAAAGAAHHHHAKGGTRTALNTLNSTELFAHLQQYRHVTVEGVLRSREGASVHPAVLALGLRYADGSIKGSTARCVALVHTLCQLIADYRTPEGKSLPRDLLASVNAAVDFVVRCRPLSVSMGNAIKAIKLFISKIDPSAPEDSAKAELIDLMREWLSEKVALADRVLVEHAVTKVYEGDTVLTYAYSQVVLEVLLAAARQGKRFRVVVVDGRPELEGRQMMRRLLQADIPCSYVFLSGASYVMREVTKVMLGAAAVLSNGTVFSRAGSAAVAMCAAASSKPVLVCCEAFKFHERVQLDSITHNELGDPDALAHLPPHAPAAAVAAGAAGADPAKGAPSASLSSWREVPRLALLNLKYDAMPAEYVTMVVTEFGMIPPSSVPVIIREYSESAQLE